MNKKQNAGQKRQQKNKKRQQKKQRQQKNSTPTLSNTQINGVLKDVNRNIPKPNEDFTGFKGQDGLIYEPVPKLKEENGKNTVDAAMRHAPEIPAPERTTMVHQEMRNGSVEFMLGDASAIKLVDTVLQEAAERADRHELWRIYHAIWRNLLSMGPKQMFFSYWDISDFWAPDDPEAIQYISITERKYSFALMYTIGRYLNTKGILADGWELSKNDPEGYMNLPMPELEDMLNATGPPEKAPQAV